MTFDSVRPVALGAIGASLIVGLALSPQAQAVVSALVTIANTTANPVPTKDVDNRARNAFATRLFPSPSNAAQITVPADKYLVIDSVTAFSFGSTTVEDVGVYTTTHGVGAGALIPFTVNNHGISYATGTFAIVADPGSTVTVVIDDSSQSDFAGMNVDLRGYYVTSP